MYVVHLQPFLESVCAVSPVPSVAQPENVLICCVAMCAGLQALQNLRAVVPAPQSRSNHAMHLACEHAYNVMTWAHNVRHAPRSCEDSAIVLDMVKVSRNICVFRSRAVALRLTVHCLPLCLGYGHLIGCSAVLQCCQKIHQPAHCCASKACQLLSDVKQVLHYVCNLIIAAVLLPEQNRAELRPRVISNNWLCAARVPLITDES